MSYFIREDYTIRPDNDFDDEREKTDTCQDEVYASARKLLDENQLESVLDIGTGSGFKLMKYFRHKKTFGSDLPPTISWVRERYPDRDWEFLPFDQPKEGYDLVIASDIIEHLLDPDEMLSFIVGCKPKFIVISTPNRDNLQEWSWPGPPRNLCHVREWSSAEFRKYMDSWFEVVDHVYPDPRRRDYSTMWVIAKLKEKL